MFSSLIGWIELNTLTFSLRSASALKEAGGSMATSETSCRRWFWNMSRKTPTRVIVTGAMFHADLFGDSDLDVIDVVAVPERLKDGVRKTRHQNVLNGLFAQIMVNAIDLILAEGLMDLLIQVVCRGQVGSKWFFDDHAPPSAVLVQLIGEAQQVNDIGENSRRRRHIIETVAGTVFPFTQAVAQLLEISQVGIAALMISQVGSKSCPFFLCCN